MDPRRNVLNQYRLDNRVDLEAMGRTRTNHLLQFMKTIHYGYKILQYVQIVSVILILLR